MNQTVLADHLRNHEQSHLLRFWDELTEQQQAFLESQIGTVDFQQIQSLFRQFGEVQHWGELAARAQPPQALRLSDVGNREFSRQDAVDRGRQALAEGQVAMILVAGGQGSRLGFEHPKGLFPIGPVSGRSLFQVLLEKLQARGQRYGSDIPLHVMTSPSTHDEIVTYLEENNWFGYPKDCVDVFCQGTMPAVDATTGRMLLSGKGELFLSPDGHGGMLSALHRNGGLQKLADRGIQYVFYCQVDNPLVQVCDPATIGCHILSRSEMTLQAVAKSRPLQRVGNIVSIDNKVRIIEYSDLPDEIAEQTNEDGSMRLWAGSIAVHVFDLAFLNRMVSHADALPFHLAHKKVAFINDNGNPIQPDSPNAVKFERFIFDLLPHAQRAIVVEVEPANAFAPVKNADTEATETAVTSRRALIEQATAVLKECGIEVEDSVDVEISPYLIENPDQLAQLATELPRIRAAIYLK